MHPQSVLCALLAVTVPTTMAYHCLKWGRSKATGDLPSNRQGFTSVLGIAMPPFAVVQMARTKKTTRNLNVWRVIAVHSVRCV